MPETAMHENDGMTGRWRINDGWLHIGRGFNRVGLWVAIRGHYCNR
jgi:hypothetical protein